MPFWQSKIKQKSVAVKADSVKKLTHPVFGPANMRPPPASTAEAIANRLFQNRISYVPVGVSFHCATRSRPYSTVYDRRQQPGLQPTGWYTTCRYHYGPAAPCGRVAVAHPNYVDRFVSGQPRRLAAARPTKRLLAAVRCSDPETSVRIGPNARSTGAGSYAVTDECGLPDGFTLQARNPMAGIWLRHVGPPGT